MEDQSVWEAGLANEASLEISILQDQSGNFPTSPAWTGTKHWDLVLPWQAGETPGASLSLEVQPPILRRGDPAVCEKNWLVINLLICYSSQVPVWLHFVPCGTGHTQGVTLQSPVGSKCGAAGSCAAFPLESQGESGQMGSCSLCGQWMKSTQNIGKDTCLQLCLMALASS